MAIDKIIATDLDGTLFYPKKAFQMVSKRNRVFIDRFMDDGGKLVLVSGRTPFSCEKLASKLGRKLDFVACNGACVVSNGMLIRDQSFETQSLKKMLEDIRSQYPLMLTALFTKHRGMVIKWSDLTKFTGLGYRLYTFFQFNYRELFVCSDRIFYEELEKGEVYKIMLMFGTSKKKIEMAEKATPSLSKAYPDASFAWSKQVVEVTPKNCTKSEGLLFYLEYNHLNHDNVLVVGDSGNDISMFDAFPKTSFCMEHSPESVQEHSAHLIKRFYELEDYVYPSAEKKSPKKETEKEGKRK